MGFLDVVFSGDYEASNNFDQYLNEDVNAPEPSPRAANQNTNIPATLASVHGGDDGKHAQFRVVDVSNQGAVTLSTDKFLITHVMETRSFRYTPLFTFGQPQVYSPNRRGTRTYQLGGSILLNHLDGDSRNDLWRAWDRELRATKMLVGPEQKIKPKILEVTFRNCVRLGYLTDLSMTPQSNTESQVGLTMSMFVVHEYFLDD